MTKDFYLVLRVDPAASTEQIRSAYRRRALQLHPDTSGAESEPFLELREAYSVLSDPERRAAYDRETRSPVFTARPFRSAGGAGREEVTPVGGFRQASLREDFDTFSPSFDEVFDRLWSNFSGLSRPKAERFESLTVDYPLSAEQAWNGGRVQVLIPAQLTCPMCGGRGGIRGYECWECQGHGSVTGEFPLELPYPAGLTTDYIVRVPLRNFGIGNFFLTVRFRPAGRGNWI